MNVHVAYRYDKDTHSWYVESNLPGYFVVADTLEEARRLVQEGLPFHLEGEDYNLTEQLPETISISIFGSLRNTSPVPFRTSEPTTTSAPDVVAAG